MTKVQPRDVSPIIALIRNFLLGRKFLNPLRFEDWLATRSPPQPILPEGPSHKLHSNYYFSRDPRGEVTPPLVIADGQVRLSAGAEKSAEVKPCLPTPGKVYKWD